MDSFSNHPCFDPQARHKYARIHLPVAPRCNLQCKYCDRQNDCINESRPGVTSGVLRPEQAFEYLNRMVEKIPQTSVVGIAGPGDPMANPEETLGTLQLVHHAYPDMLLCLASNGLAVVPYLDDLAALKVSHVTITVNAVDPEVGASIYSWMRYNKRTHSGAEAAEYLWEQQKASILGLKERGITVKINSLLIPTINDQHLSQVAQTVSRLGADLFNIIPLYPVAGTEFFPLGEPDSETLRQVRAKCGLHIPQMSHCQRCRADAAGLLGLDHQDTVSEINRARRTSGTDKLSSPCTSDFCSSSSLFTADKTGLVRSKNRAAVATLEGALVNLHLGQAQEFAIYEKQEDCWKVVETRKAPESGKGDDRWLSLCSLLKDCGALFVSGAGQAPQKVFQDQGFPLYTVEGLIDELLNTWSGQGNLEVHLKSEVHACGEGCRGGGGMC